MITAHSVYSNEQEDAIDLVLDERRYQDSKWGGPGFDDTNTEADWLKYIADYATGPRGDGYSFAKRMQKVAALGLAALESEIRKGRQPE